MAIVINTIEELQLIGNDAGYPLDGDYELDNDIDASVTSTWNGGLGFDPIGSEAAPFTGSFDGKLKKIISLFIDKEFINAGTAQKRVGLFGWISGALIKDLGIINCSVNGSGTFRLGVAALAGNAIGGSINNCFADGSVFSLKQNVTSGNSAGLVAYSSAEINSCYAKCNVSVESDGESAGFVFKNLSGGVISNCAYDGTSLTATSGYEFSGFCAYNLGVISECEINLPEIIPTYDFIDSSGFCYRNDGQIIGCDVHGDLSNNGYGAGLVYVNYGTIENCSYSGNFSSDYSGAFVFTNEANATISECVCTGSHSNGYTGGPFCYVNEGTIERSFFNGTKNLIYGYDVECLFVSVNEPSGVIRDCYTNGEISIDTGLSEFDLAGFTSYNEGLIERCYAVIRCERNEVLANSENGFCGDNTGTINSCYWDTETSGILVSDGGEGRTTAEMQTQSTFVGWDFETLWGLSIYDEYKYPKFLCADFSATQVSGEAPLEVGFTNSSIDEAFPVETFLWDFGDGSYSSEENPTHTYTTSGEFTVILIISSKGLSSIDKIFVTILNVAGDTLSKFISTPRYGVFPFRVDFNNLSINSNTYLWDFGDGDTSTEANPTHYYSAPGKYTVTLTSINSTDTDIKVKEVYINSVSNKYQLNGYLSGSGIVEVPYKACSEFVTLGWIKSPLCANGEYLIPLAIGDINGKVVDSDRALKFMLKKENNDFRFVFNNSESQLIFKSVSINLQDDSWHSLGWVCVDSSGTMKFLVDGVEVPVRLGYNSSTGLVYSKAYSSVGRVGGGEVWCPYLSNSGQRITLYNWRFAKGVSLDNNWIEELFKIDKLNLGLM